MQNLRQERRLCIALFNYRLPFTAHSTKDPVRAAPEAGSSAFHVVVDLVHFSLLDRLLQCCTPIITSIGAVAFLSLFCLLAITTITSCYVQSHLGQPLSTERASVHVNAVMALAMSAQTSRV